jgi:hypothetical protein
MSNVSRRGLFGVGAGAAIAGPSAIKSVLSDYQVGGLKGSTLGMVSEKYLGPMEDGDWMRSQLKDLLSERESIDKLPTAASTGYPQRVTIDNLRSVSQANRARMIAEHDARREREIRLGWMDKRIEELKAKLGHLGQLLDFV